MRPELAQHFRYVALDAAGRRIRGRIEAPGEGAAFERLRASGLSPLRLQPARPDAVHGGAAALLSDQETVDLVSNLGHLLKAGADMRTALAILGERAARPQASGITRALSADIGGGAALDLAFERHLKRHGAFVGAMVAAGEASGDLAGALLRAAEIIESRQKLKARLGSVLAYPLFVLACTIAAVLALLLFVIPALAPLLQDVQSAPPLTLRLMIGASELIRGHLSLIGLAAVGMMLAGLAAHRSGLLGRVVDRLLLDGPVRRTARGLTYGGFAIVAGGMLTAGAPMSDTLRLAVRALNSPLARRRIEPIQQMVRQGQSLSAAAESISGFPASIARLAAVGEATGALGPMLARGGRLEEDAAMARIERLGQLLGPALIVGLGALVGLLMAGLLSGVSQLGQTALQ